MPETIVNRNTAVALVAGGLLGAGVALLFAHQSGSKTRRDIRHLAEKTKNRVEEAQIEWRHSIENIVGEAAERIGGGLNRGIDWSDSKIAEFQRVLDGGRQFIQREIEKIQSS